MKIIKYFNKELVKMVTVEEEALINEPIYEMRQLKYETTNNEFKKWHDIIKKTYGKYGDVTVEDGGTAVKSKEELQSEINAQLLKDSANLQIQLKKQQELNATLLIKIAQLGGAINA